MRELHHIGMVVSNRDAAIVQLSSIFATGPAYSFEAEYPFVEVLSKAASFRLRIAFLWLGSIMVEVIRPLDDVSPQAQFLRVQGGGLHHLAFVVDSINQELESIGPAHQSAQLLVNATAPRNQVRWCYIQLDEQWPIVELIEREPALDFVFEDICRVTGAPLR